MDNNLELYKIFHMVANYANISLASEKLFISQPAVSKAIQKLEGIVGTKLFSRSSRGVKLTEEGRIFYQYIDRAIKQINLGEKVLHKLKKRELGSFKLGVSTTLCKHFLIPKLKRFIKDYPNIEIKIRNHTSTDNLSLLEKGEIDLCIISEPLEEKEVYEFIKLSDIHDIFVASPDYLDSLKLIQYDDIFTAASFLLLEPANISRMYIDKYFSNKGIIVKPEIETSNMDILVEFAKIGLGITAVIKEFVKIELEKGTLIEIVVDPMIPKRNIGLVYNKNIPLSLAAQTFIGYVSGRDIEL